MPTHVVAQRECFATIARDYGFPRKTLYDHPDNADLKKKRPNPNILHPGDEVSVPDLEPKEASVATDLSHRFKIKVAKRELRLTLLDPSGEPIAGAAYVLEVEGWRYQGETSAKGELLERIPTSARTATLTVGERVLVLACAGINPMTDVDDGGVSGARQRLYNLGYDVGDGSTALDPRTRTAVALFQHEAKIPVTGELDDATRSKLASLHRC
jgi:N-acetylmuramoyl-L-alanine amidase